MQQRAESEPAKSKHRRHSATIVGALHEKSRKKRTNSLTQQDLPVPSFSMPSLSLKKNNAAVLDLSQKTNREQFSEFQDGLLCKNTKSFDTVDFCFVCNRHVVPDEWALKPSIEITGMKFNGAANMIPVYRQIFLCPACCQDVDERKQHKTLLSASVIKMTNNAREFF
jgi:hypothetical protein